ncbi:MYXO-CTERM sorting domain-containing protein [Myxococcus stipitatus]
MLNSESGTPGPRSPDTGFQVRGPTALDVGCGGCGASPTGAATAWVLLIGVAALLRQRRRQESGVRVTPTRPKRGPPAR